MTHKSFGGGDNNDDNDEGDGGTVEEKGKDKSTDDPDVQGREGAPRSVAEGSYERLEFLGDCLLKFITSVHLYFTASADVREVRVRVRVRCAFRALYQPATAGHADRPAFDAGAEHMAGPMRGEVRPRHLPSARPAVCPRTRGQGPGRPPRITHRFFPPPLLL